MFFRIGTHYRKGTKRGTEPSQNTEQNLAKLRNETEPNCGTEQSQIAE